MNQLIPVLLAVVSMTLIWGSIVNVKPFDALKELLRGNDPRKAAPIDRAETEASLPKLSNVPKSIDGKPVIGVWMPQNPAYIKQNQGKFMPPPKPWYPVVEYDNGNRSIWIDSWNPADRVMPHISGNESILIPEGQGTREVYGRIVPRNELPK